MAATAPLVPDEPLLPPRPAGRPLGVPAAGTCRSATSQLHASAPAVAADLHVPAGPATAAPGALRILERGAQSGRLTHLEHLPARRGRLADWPAWVPRHLTEALRDAGVSRP